MNRAQIENTKNNNELVTRIRDWNDISGRLLKKIIIQALIYDKLSENFQIQAFIQNHNLTPTVKW